MVAQISQKIVDLMIRKAELTAQKSAMAAQERNLQKEIDKLIAIMRKS